MDDILGGFVEKLIPGTQGKEEFFDSLADYHINRYGSKDKLLNAIEQDPAGFLSDVSLVLGALGVVARTAGTISKVSTLSKIGKGITATSRLLEPTTLAIKTAQTFNKYSGIQKLFKITARQFMAKGIEIGKTSEVAIARTNIGNIQPVDWLNQHGIYGSLDDISKQLGNIQRKTKIMVDNSLEGVGQLYKSEAANKILFQVDNLLSTKKGIPTPGLSDEFTKKQ